MVYGLFSSSLDFLLPHLARLGHFPHPGPLLHLDSLILEGVSKDGDRFLLCSDGLVRVMEDPELEDWLVGLRSETLKREAQGLVDEANKRGAPDNVTVAAVLVEGAPTSPS